MQLISLESPRHRQFARLSVLVLRVETTCNFLAMCTGQHHCQHAGEVGRAFSTLEAAEKCADDQFVYCRRTAPDWWR